MPCSALSAHTSHPSSSAGVTASCSTSIPVAVGQRQHAAQRHRVDPRQLDRRDAERLARPPGERRGRALGDERRRPAVDRAQQHRLVGAVPLRLGAQPGHRLEIGPLDPRLGTRIATAEGREREGAVARGGGPHPQQEFGGVVLHPQLDPRKPVARPRDARDRGIPEGIEVEGVDLCGAPVPFGQLGHRVDEARAMQPDGQHGAVGDQPGIGGEDGRRGDVAVVPSLEHAALPAVRRRHAHTLRLCTTHRRGAPWPAYSTPPPSSRRCSTAATTCSGSTAGPAGSAISGRAPGSTCRPAPCGMPSAPSRAALTSARWAGWATSCGPAPPARRSLTPPDIRMPRSWRSTA